MELAHQSPLNWSLTTENYVDELATVPPFFPHSRCDRSIQACFSWTSRRRVARSAVA